VKRALLEGLLIAAVGVAVAFAANAFSGKGLRLTYNYFPASATAGVAAGPAAGPPTTNGSLPVAPGATNLNPTLQRLREKNLQVVQCDEALALVRDLRYLDGRVIFIDARDDEHYQAGHVPGAYQFDRYHWDKYLGDLLPVCQAAQQIVVYCKGGECEDSEFAALMLRDDAHVPGEKLAVFPGGITEWQERKLPMEAGSRQPPQPATFGK
jgi:rhodanese-related sulfurtransferase